MTEIAARLRESGITIRDVGVNLRRYEKRGHVYFRVYRNAEHETPFAAGYIVAYVDPNTPRETAIAEATERTDLLLDGGFRQEHVIVVLPSLGLSGLRRRSSASPRKQRQTS